MRIATAVSLLGAFFSLSLFRANKMISELLPEEKRRLHELEEQLNELERCTSRGISCMIQSSDVDMGLKELSNRIEELDKLVQKESKTRRDDYRRRLQHLKTSFNHIKSSYENYLRRYEKQTFENQKRELFGSQPNDLSNMELEMAENGSLSRSSKQITDYIAVGQDTLSNLISQKERLKGIQRKVFDILNYLGLANTLMKAVEKRDFTDKWLVYGGMLLLSGFIFIVWFCYVR